MDNKRKEVVYEICLNGIIAALYATLTIFIAPLSYGPIQFRFSEILVLLCFFNKRYAIGLTLGCLIANCFSPTAVLDIPFGTFATALACLGIMFSKWLILAITFPVICNAFIVALEFTILDNAPYWFNAGTIALGELAVMAIGYIFFFFIKRSTHFLNAIKANQNREFKF